MKMMPYAAAVALLALTGWHTVAEAQPRARDLTIRGCARMVVPFCTVVVHRGVTYVLHNAAPPIPPRTFVRVTGRVSGNVGICPGMQMAVTSWRKARGVCP
jgi:hypothetical protein